MSTENHYQTLGVNGDATIQEIKAAYRELAKQFHPDRSKDSEDVVNPDRIVAINAAYAVLKDQDKRRRYDQQRFWDNGGQDVQTRQDRTQSAQTNYQRRRQAQSQEDDEFAQWIRQVYRPVNTLLGKVLSSYRGEIAALAADPFDGELMETFETYLATCGEWQAEAERLFRSRPNPPKTAAFATALYYCLGHVGDALGELGYFTSSYDEDYLHSGREMFRLAAQFRREAQAAYRDRPL